MRLQVTLFLFTLLLASSCSRFNRLVKSGDYPKKLAAAEKYYAKKDYYRALTLYEQLQDYYNNSDKAEEMLYYNAYCNYELRNYTISGYLFKTYVENFPSGKRVEECYFMYATCLMKDTYSAELDPSNIYKAIEEFKLFTNIFPDSKYIPECNTHIDALRGTLSFKAYRNAKMYYRIEDYKAAIITLNNVLRDFPEIPQREELEFLILKSTYLLAKNSVEEKKKDRLQQTMTAYTAFIENYPTSKYRKEADDISKLTVLMLTKFDK